MFPVLVVVPGVAFKFVVPILLLGAIAMFAAPFVAKLRKLAAPKPRTLDAALTLVIAVGLFLLVAPVPMAGEGILERVAFAPIAFVRGLFSRSVWSAQWQGVPLYAYGSMLLLSFAVGWRITLGLAEKVGIPRARAAEAFIVTGFVAVLGSRVLYVLTNLDEFRDPATHRLVPAAMLSFRSGGLVAYGGFLGGLLASWSYFRGRDGTLLKWADAAVPSLASGLALTRIGCFLYGCDFGRPLGEGAPRWVRRIGTFPHWRDHTGSPAWHQHVTLGFHADAARCRDYFHGDFYSGLCHLDSYSSASAPVHPTQLYESAIGAALFAFLLWAWRRRRFDGEVFLAFGAIYGFARAALEVLRDDQERGFVWNFSTSQIIGVSSAAACVVVWAMKMRALRRTASTAGA